jgi:16S rRNA G527 N7-methylase RsmG
VQFDLAVARALGKTEDVLGTCLRLVSPGGRLVLFKGPLWAAEVETASAIATDERALAGRTETIPLPGFDRATTFIEFHVKHADTD